MSQVAPHPLRRAVRILLRGSLLGALAYLAYLASGCY